MKDTLVLYLLRLPICPKRISECVRQAMVKKGLVEFHLPLKTAQGKLFLRGTWSNESGMFYFDPIDYEKELNPILAYILTQDKKPQIIDVGANWGQSIFKFKSIARCSTIHSFEVFSDMIDFCERNIKINQWKDVSIMKALISDIAGCKKIFFKANSVRATASSIKGFQPFFNDSQDVDAITLDSYVRNAKIKKISLLKIDVEGGEFAVLQGAGYTLERFKPDIILELLASAAPRQRSAIDLLQKRHYNFYHIRRNGELEYEDKVKPDVTYKQNNYFVSLKKPEQIRSLLIK